MFKTTSDYKLGKKTIFVYGPAKVGKTTLITTLPEDKKTLIINAEQGMLSISGKREMHVYDLTLDDEGKEINRKARPQRLLNFMFNILPQMANRVDWVVLDSLTEIADCLEESLRETAINEKGKFDNFIYYRELKSFLVKMSKMFRDFPNVSFLIIGHDKIRTDNFKIDHVEIGLPGASRNELAKIFDFIFYMFIDESGNRKLATASTSTVICGDRSGKLLPIEEPSLTNILNKMDS